MKTLAAFLKELPLQIGTFKKDNWEDSWAFHFDVVLNSVEERLQFQDMLDASGDTSLSIIWYHGLFRDYELTFSNEEDMGFFIHEYEVHGEDLHEQSVHPLKQSTNEEYMETEQALLAFVSYIEKQVEQNTHLENPLQSLRTGIEGDLIQYIRFNEPNKALQFVLNNGRIFSIDVHKLL